MNYFEHHIGDYDADTSHLTWCEDMAYTRLLRLYYRREKPIPADINDACRLIRATAKDQKQAVSDVLREFFTLADDGWHQRRADDELERYQVKVEHNRRVGKLGGRPRKEETQQKPTGLSVGSIREPEQNPLQSPDTSLQTPKEKARALLSVAKPESDAESPGPTAAGAICRAMRLAGLSAVNPGDPRLLALVEQGATEGEFTGIAAEAVEKGKGWAWVLHVVQARRAEAAAIELVPVPVDPSAWRKDDRARRAMALQLGVACRPDERMEDWQRRIFTAWQRAGQPALQMEAV